MLKVKKKKKAPATPSIAAVFHTFTLGSSKSVWELIRYKSIEDKKV